jgi:phosphatidylglycerophosphatase A
LIYPRLASIILLARRLNLRLRMQPNWNFLLQHPAHFIAFGAGAGLAKRAPGTWGTLVALPLYWLAQQLGGWAAVAAAGVLIFIIGIWASSVTGRALGVADHGGIVIDEIAAFLLVLATVPFTWQWVAVAFLLFRVFDITKPWPINVADQRIKGGFGVMFDDLLAAVYSILCLLLLQKFL